MMQSTTFGDHCTATIRQQARSFGFEVRRQAPRGLQLYNPSTRHWLYVADMPSWGLIKRTLRFTGLSEAQS